jgi:hypothetical protein
MSAAEAHSHLSGAVQQAPGLWRTDLQQHDLGVPGREVVQQELLRRQRLPPGGSHGVPEEYVQAPRSWTEQAYHNLIYLNQDEKGGQFAAWEQPPLFSEELRAAFRTLR